MITVKSFEFNYFAVNTYLLFDETREAIVVDCGCMNSQEEALLSDFITLHDLTIKRLLCTHLHLDHLFGNHYLYQTYGIKPEAHQADTEMLPSPQEQARLFGIQDPIKEVDFERYILGNEIISFGTSHVKALRVPGHSPGSLAFYSEADGFALVGDALFCGSIGRTDLWGGNQEVLIAAIKDKLLCLPDETILYSGHGSDTNVFNENLNNPFIYKNA